MHAVSIKIMKVERKFQSQPYVLRWLELLLGLAVMIISVAVVIGFKHQVRDKVIGLSSDILVTSMDEAQAYQTTPVVGGDSVMQMLRSLPSVSHVQRYASKPGMIMTADNFQGMLLKGYSSGV